MIAGVTDLPASPERRGDIEPRPGDYCYLPLLEEMGFLPSKKFADGDRAVLRQSLEQMRQNLSRRPLEPMVSHG